MADQLRSTKTIMRITSKQITWTITILLAVAIKVFSLFPAAVERYYSDGLYPVISKTQRILFGWIPFSIGDILYAIAIIALIRVLFQGIRRIRIKQFNKDYALLIIQRFIFVALIIYTLFNLLWGLNYNRIGIAQQLNLAPTKISDSDLVVVMNEIIQKVNQLDTPAHLSPNMTMKKRDLFKGSRKSYTELQKQNSLFIYSYASVKPSLYSYLGNYLGFTGYYNPFSGEAQVNTTVPEFILPFTTCHEIGHQLGYAKESEANFAGYLSATASNDPAFQYSAYFDLYLYGRRYVYLADSTRGRQMDSLLNPGVQRDIHILREFLNRHANPVEEVIDALYGQYLKANEQPSGKISYNEVIIWLIAYYRKYGKI